MNSVATSTALVSTIAFVLLVISHVADWQLQAEQHGWAGLWWTRYARGARWPWYADWIPHDAWHCAQTARNWCALASCMIVCIAWPYAYWTAPIVFIALYAAARALGFSLPRKLTQGY